MQLAGEEDALARGALRAMVHPANGGSFLAAFALGFVDHRMPSGLWSCPNPQHLCAVAGGYAYLLDTSAPERASLLELRPVAGIVPIADPSLLVFVGLHSLAAWGAQGLAWHTPRLSWEGVRITGVEAGQLHGLGWDLHTDREPAFTVDLATGRHTGGAFPDAT